jgi:hypothetical protein
MVSFNRKRGIIRFSDTGEGGTDLTPATWNSSDKGSNVSLAYGDLAARMTGVIEGVRATQGVSSGKYYWEFTPYSSALACIVGLANSSYSLTTFIGTNSNSVGVQLNNTAYASNFSQYDRGMVALNMDDGEWFMGRNGTWFDSGDPAAGTNPRSTGLTGTMFPAYSDGGGSGTHEVIMAFASATWVYTAPSGFIELSE